MSDIAAIRAKLETILAGVAGITSAHAYPPDGVGALPLAFVGLNDVAIAYTAGLEVNDHTLQVVVLVERIAGELPTGLKELETIEAAFRAAMRQNVGLSNTVALCTIARIQQDTVRIGQALYIGFVATLAIHDKFGVSLG